MPGPSNYVTDRTMASMFRAMRCEIVMCCGSSGVEDKPNRKRDVVDAVLVLGSQATRRDGLWYGLVVDWNGAANLLEDSRKAGA